MRFQLWNPWNGEMSSLSGFSTQTSEGTELTLPLSYKEIQLIVFDPENTACQNVVRPERVVRQIDLDNTWEFELKPSLDNQWGDFQLPAKKEFLGAQIRQLHFSENRDYTGERLVFDSAWKTVTCAFGPQFLKLGALPELPSETELLKMNSQKAGDEVEVAGKKYRWEEYAFSWKQGVEGDYGHQGYHGLKGQMYDNFIRMGAVKEKRMSKFRVAETSGNFYVLSSTVIAPEEGTYELLSGEEKPVLLFVNNQKMDTGSKTVSLKKGANPIVLVYDKACETYLTFRQPLVPRPAKQPVSICWYGDSGVLPFDCSSSNNRSGLFAFESAPGLRSLTFSAYGKIDVWADGVKQQLIAGQQQADGLIGYRLDLKNPNAESSQIVLEVEYQAGRCGVGAFPSYFDEDCGKGMISLGDWSKIDGLRSYSGGVWYRKNIQLQAADLKNKVEIDLGDLVSSAEVLVNGQRAGIRLSPPWKFDITKFAKVGENRIEVLVYNTLSNNFVAIPTRYQGEMRCGLIGPVKLNLIENEPAK